MDLFSKKRGITDPLSNPSKFIEQQPTDPSLANNPLAQELANLEEQMGKGSDIFDFKSNVIQRNYDENFLKFTLEIKHILNELEHTLKSEVYDEESKDWIPKKDARPLLNDYGVNKIIALLKSFLDKNTTLSCFDEQDINNTMTAIGRLLADTLYAEWEDFGLQDKEDPDEAMITTIDQIWEMVTNAIYSSLLRAKNGLTLKVISNVYKAEEKGQPQQPQRRSFNPLIK